MMSAEEVDRRIGAYVEKLKAQGDIRSEPVEAAFRRVPRHRLVRCFFVDSEEYSSKSGFTAVVADPESPTDAHLDLIYSHRALVTRLGANGLPSSSTSMPGLVAKMLELLRLDRGHRVLEIGAGTGYNAALMAEVVGSQRGVVAIDIQEDVVEETRDLLRAAGYGDIKLMAGDGFYGVPHEAPFDRIVSTVGLFDISPHWRGQLAADGEMLLPVYLGGAAPLLRVRRNGRGLVGRVVGLSGFMPIQGEMCPADSCGSDTTDDVVEPRIERIAGWSAGTDRSFRWDLWFFVSAADGRGSLLPVPGQGDGTWTKWTFGLQEGPARVVVGQDELVLVGDAEPLLVRLNELRDVWESHSRPKASDFEIEFLPRECETEAPNGLIVERKYHRQILHLGDGTLGRG